MKKMLRLSLLGSLVVFASAVVAADLGDPAPALQIAEWVKGKPVDLAAGKGKNVFVVEFWATWCPPCRTSIPHLTEMQKKLKDKGVVFIGVSNEKVPTVKKFVDQMGNKMDYAVAVDKDQKTSQGYMEAYGINGIPHAFVVDKEGRVVWNGHPMDGLDKAIEAVLSGKFDLAAAKKRAKAGRMMEEFWELAASGEDEAKADKLAQELTALDKELGGITDGEKFDATKVRKQAKFQRTMMEYQQTLAQGKDTAKEAELEKKVQEQAPPEFKLDEFKDNFKLQRLLQKYYAAVTGRGEAAQADELARQIGEVKPKNPLMLNDFAWRLLTDEKITKRDFPLALKLAKAACEASEGKDANVLDTYARALFESGQVEEAIKQQKQAIELNTNDESKEEFAKSLKRYQEKAK